MDTKPVFHGSDIEKICSYYGLKKEDIVKFGANVNPLGLSPKASAAIAAHVDIFSSYPDREYTSLRQCIAGYCGSEAEHVIVGNGSTELISLFIQIEHPKKAMIIGPHSGKSSKAHPDPGTYLFRILQRAFFFRKHPGILPPSGKQRFRAGHSRSLQKAGTGIRFSHSLQP